MAHSGSKSMIPDDIKSSTPSSEQVAHTKQMLKKETESAGDSAPSRSASVRSSNRSPSVEPAPSSSSSKNPLKKIFRRSKSHHVDQGKGSTNPFNSSTDIRQRASPKLETKTRSRGASLLHKDKDAASKMHIIKSSSAIPSLASHNTNPFLNSVNGKIPLESLDIHARPPTVSQLYHSPSSASATPSSTSLGFYQTEGDSKGENILPLPMKNPNDFLPDELKQPSVMLTDNFAFVDSGRRTLGEGGSSQVMTVVSLYRKKQVYALKRFKLFKDETPDHFYHRCITEFIIAKKLSDHVNIIKTYYIMKTPSVSNGPKRSWAFLMQQCVQDMFHYTTLSGWATKPLDEKWCCFKQIARGVRHMHSLGIVHRDIKLENVLVTDYGALKLTDFGISTYGIKNPEDPNSERIKIRGYCGSPPHVPPEVMILSEKKKKIIPVPKDKEEYDPFKMDTWALGILMFNLVCPFALFGEAHKDDSKYRHYVSFYETFCKHSPHFKKPGIYRSGPGAEHPDFSKLGGVEASRVCLRLLDPNPETRYSIEDLFNDPWMDKIDSSFDETQEEPIQPPQLRKATTDDDPVPHDIPSTGSSFSEDGNSVAHSSNPFLETPVKTKIKSKSMLFIAEEEDQRRSASNSGNGSPKIGSTASEVTTSVASAALPTLDEEKTKEGDDETNDRADSSFPSQEQPIPVSAIEPRYVLCVSPEVNEPSSHGAKQPLEKKISSLSLNTTSADGNSSPNILKRQPLDISSPNGLTSARRSGSTSASVSRSSSIASRSSASVIPTTASAAAAKRKKNVVSAHNEPSGTPMFSIK